LFEHAPSEFRSGGAFADVTGVANRLNEILKGRILAKGEGVSPLCHQISEGSMSILRGGGGACLDM